MHYRLVQQLVQKDPVEEQVLSQCSVVRSPLSPIPHACWRAIATSTTQDKAYDVLHNEYAPVMLNLILQMRGASRAGHLSTRAIALSPLPSS